MPDVAGEVLERRFPRLYRRTHIDYANCDVSFTTGPFDDALISRLHLVAVDADGHVIVCGSDLGWRFLPGGTREPGESVQHLARRELLEEAGARIVDGTSVRLFGAHVADSLSDGPWKAHLPYPRAMWAYAVCRADIVGPPTCPVDGEQVTEVLAMDVEPACAYLDAHDPMHADVLRLAHALALV